VTVRRADDGAVRSGVDEVTARGFACGGGAGIAFAKP
jgi:hypothetical protein